MNRQVREDTERWRALCDRETQGLPNVTTALALAVIARESRGDPNALGSTSDFGLMQVTRPAWQDFQAEVNDPSTVPFPDAMLTPEGCVRVGCWFLNRKIAEMGNVRDGLRAYNAGTAGAMRNPLQSAAYADWVLSVGIPAFQRAV